MTPLTTLIPAATRELGTAEGNRSDRARRLARDAEERFFARHGTVGQRFLYRLIAALS